MDPIERDQSREHRELVQDLLPSPPNEPSTSSSTSGNAATTASTNRVVTVNDLKHRNCWICAEGDDDEEEQDTSKTSTTDTNPTNSNRRSSKKKRRPRRLRNFVHPCVCTLIAHESCLLTWIHQKSTPTNPIVSCPQCSSPFLLRSPKPWTLKSFEWMDKNWNSKILPRLVIGGGVGLIWSGLCWYGKWAVRAWMGGKASQNVLARSWSKRWFFELGFVPLGLLSLRIPGSERIPMIFLPLYFFNYTGLLHTYVFHIIGFFFQAHPIDKTTGREIENYWEPVQVAGGEMMKWPPAPEVTLFLIPFVRSLYRVLRLRVTRYVLKPFIKKPPRSVTPRRPTAQANGQGQQGAAAAAPPRRLRRRIVIIGGEENQLVDADAEVDGPLPVGVEAIAEGNPEGINPNNDDDNSDDEDEIAGHRVEEHEALAEGDRPPQHRQRIDQTIYVSPQSLMKLAISALSLPFISAVTGEVAEWIVTTKTMKYGNNWLARFLNVTPASGREMRSSWWSWMTSRLGTATSSSSPSPTFSDSLGWLKNKDRSSTDVNSSSPPRHTPTTLSTIYPRSDHWRNTISLCIYLVCSDTLSLAYRYLRLNQRTKTRVVDRPFRGKELLEGLELK